MSRRPRRNHSAAFTVDISAIVERIEALLDGQVEGVTITAPIVEGDDRGGRVDPSDIDFEKLAKPRTADQQLASEAQNMAQQLAQQNPTRQHWVEKPTPTQGRSGASAAKIPPPLFPNRSQTSPERLKG